MIFLSGIQSIYLLVVDYYSRYIEIARLSRPTTAEVVTHLKSIFARHGITDNGPQYSSREFGEFAKDFEFRHITSSPYHPQGNGEAERAVGTIKNLLKKGDDPYKSLLAYRSTPLQVGYSPNGAGPPYKGNLKFRTSPPCRQKTGGTNKDRRETSILIMGQEDCHHYTQEIVFGSLRERVKQRSRRRSRRR